MNLVEWGVVACLVIAILLAGLCFLIVGCSWLYNVLLGDKSRVIDTEYEFDDSEEHY